MASEKRSFHITLLLAVLAGTYGCQQLAPDPGTPPALGAGFSSQQRISAMMSVHAHARYFPQHILTPQFMPLPQAKSILRNDVGVAAQSRRRRAAAKLAAYWSHKFPVPSFLDDVEDIAGLQAALAVDTYFNELAGAALPPAAKIEIELQKKLFFVTQSCPWDPKVLVGGPYDPPPPAGWSYDVLFPRYFDDIARALDPQSWNQCSELFRDSYLVTTPSCCPNNGTNDCSSPVPMDPAPKRGKPYASTALYEEFCHDEEDECGSCMGLATVECDLSFKTLVCVKTSYTPYIWSSDALSQATRYDVEFHLGQSLGVEVDGDEEERYQLDSDEGESSVRPATSSEIFGLPTSPAWSLLHVQKDLTFNGSGITDEVGRALKAFEDELAGEIMELGCCDVPFVAWENEGLARLKDWQKRLRRRLPNYRVPIPRDLGESPAVL